MNNKRPSQSFHVISGDRLLDLLRRARDGESPDVLMAEEWANAEHEDVRSPRCQPYCVKEFGAESCDAFGQPCLDAKE